MKRMKTLALGLAVTLAMAGGGLAFAQSKTTQGAAPTVAQSGAPSLTADAQTGENNTMDAESGANQGEGKDVEASDGGSGENGDPAAVGTPAIGYDQAVKAAELYAKTGSAQSASLEDENGKLVYAVLVNGADIKIDAATGSVVKVDGGDAAADNSGNDGENKD